jgi:Kelch motif protein
MLEFETIEAPRPLGDHCAALLADGRVLMVGAEYALLFDPASRAWRDVARSPELGSHGLLTALDDGRALLVTGNRAAVWDGWLDAWTSTAPMVEPHRQPLGSTATPLPDGNVLVVGGYVAEDAPIPAAEIFDPVRSKWRSAPPLPEPRANHHALVLTDGALLYGGTRDTAHGPERRLERWDHRAAKWTTIGSFEAGGRAVVLADGRVLFAEGALLDVHDGSIRKLARGCGERARLVVLEDGRAVAIDEQVEVYDPDADGWSVIGRLPAPLSGKLTWLGDDRFLLASGFIQLTSPATILEPARSESVPSVLCAVIQLRAPREPRLQRRVT